MTSGGNGRAARVSRFFFLHLGTLVGLVVYLYVFESNSRSEIGLRNGLVAALVVHSAYMAVAWRAGELKQADVGFWLLYAAGAVGVFAGSAWWIYIYQMHTPAVIFATFCLAALLPPIFGGRYFTAHYMERSLPRWQLRLPVTGRIGRLMWAYWVAIFAACTAMTLWAPLDPRFTALYPNLLIFGVGVTAQYWLPPLYMRAFPPEPPSSLEPMIMGMPTVFDARAARGVRAEIQFHVSGVEPGDYWLRIADGRCAAFEGRAPAPDVTVHTPDSVWLAIVRGEIDGAQALADGRYSVAGDASILARLSEWFPARRQGLAA